MSSAVNRKCDNCSVVAWCETKGYFPDGRACQQIRAVYITGDLK